jgi:hypothetical protein
MTTPMTEILPNTQPLGKATCSIEGSAANFQPFGPTEVLMGATPQPATIAFQFSGVDLPRTRSRLSKLILADPMQRASRRSERKPAPATGLSGQRAAATPTSRLGLVYAMQAPPRCFQHCAP